ncbi:hypothetical protein BC938DRAFT_479322 [Jimgerdemannia flammicorona]|uniref:F-box domain-containing protein n=1 Tax=Jimgerdemannia flammicorona TaxID=994334 RepID=A0A433QXW6_9FUNG|nr:hypothetical protein BC938DRAFT_479322 [Jimgerdemannia flammicorona]
MLTSLPPELFLVVLSYLDFHDAETLLYVSTLLRTHTLHHLHSVFPFEASVTSLLSSFDTLPPPDRHNPALLTALASQLLDQIRVAVEAQPKWNHRACFIDHLDTLQHLVLRRLTHPRYPQPGLERRYAELCLQVRQLYLHSPALRLLHDPKYRRRSTRLPSAPFLPREYIDRWRRNCQESALDFPVISLADLQSGRFRFPLPPIFSQPAPGFPLASLPTYDAILQRRSRRLAFARFYGALFHVSSIYLESHLDGTMEECVREALVSGDVESLLEMYTAAGRDIDVDVLCAMVTNAGEQLYTYLNDLPSGAQQQEGGADGEANQLSVYEMPEWLRPERYQVRDEVVLRLRVLAWLRKMGWEWD